MLASGVHLSSVPHYSNLKSIEASEENIMKRYFGYALMLALMAAPAFAAKNSQSLNLATPVKVGTTELPAGDVKVSWTGTGDSVQVTIAQNGKTLTIPAKLVEEKHTHKGYVVSREAGADQLQTIQLSNVSLQLDSATASGR
jgi:hypothetical protein